MWVDLKLQKALAASIEVDIFFYDKAEGSTARGNMKIFILPFLCCFLLVAYTISTAYPWPEATENCKSHLHEVVNY